MTRPEPDLHAVLDTVDAALDAMRCPGASVGYIAHCAECCFGFGYEVSCEEDEALVRALLDVRKVLAPIREVSR